MSIQPMIVLLVEDNDAHAELVIRGLANHSVTNKIYHVRDGEAALQFLYREGLYAEPGLSPRPHVILLDLRLPKIDGVEVIQEIKSSPDLKMIPVVVLTTSDLPQDLERAYGLCANSYLVKPADFQKFQQMIKDLGFYWLLWNR
jgi:two-component system, response regulator